jgi:hypothetical protein
MQVCNRGMITVETVIIAPSESSDWLGMGGKIKCHSHSL